MTEVTRVDKCRSRTEQGIKANEEASLTAIHLQALMERSSVNLRYTGKWREVSGESNIDMEREIL